MFVLVRNLKTREYKLGRLKPGKGIDYLEGKYPHLTFEPVDKLPSPDEIEGMLLDGECWTPVCGCEVEPDGFCPHGRPSWLMALGLI